MRKVGPMSKQKTKEKTNDHLGIIPGLSCLGDQCFKGENKLDNPRKKQGKQPDARLQAGEYPQGSSG